MKPYLALIICALICTVQTTAQSIFEKFDTEQSIAKYEDFELKNLDKRHQFHYKDDFKNELKIQFSSLDAWQTIQWNADSLLQYYHQAQVLLAKKISKNLNTKKVVLTLKDAVNGQSVSDVMPLFKWEEYPEAQTGLVLDNNQMALYKVGSDTIDIIKRIWHINRYESIGFQLIVNDINNTEPQWETNIRAYFDYVQSTLQQKQMKWRKPNGSAHQLLGLAYHNGRQLETYTSDLSFYNTLFRSLFVDVNFGLMGSFYSGINFTMQTSLGVKFKRWSENGVHGFVAYQFGMFSDNKLVNGQMLYNGFHALEFGTLAANKSALFQSNRYSLAFGVYRHNVNNQVAFLKEKPAFYMGIYMPIGEGFNVGLHMASSFNKHHLNNDFFGISMNYSICHLYNRLLN
jgi:hypothetical protein